MSLDERLPVVVCLFSQVGTLFAFGAAKILEELILHMKRNTLSDNRCDFLKLCADVGIAPGDLLATGLLPLHLLAPVHASLLLCPLLVDPLVLRLVIFAFRVQTFQLRIELCDL